MDKFTKILGEHVELSTDTKSQIQEAWDSKIAEVKEELHESLRAEYAKKFTHDMSVLTETADKFITDVLNTQVQKMATERKKVRENIATFEQFMVSQLAEEVKELKEDRQSLTQNFSTLENFIIKQLHEEIAEFRKDKQALTEQKIKLVKEGKAQLVQAKAQFIKEAAEVTSKAIDTILTNELTQFREDIVAARNNDFGRRIFEAFASEYMSSYLNEGSDVKRLQAELAKKDVELQESVKKAEDVAVLAEGLQTELGAVKAKIARNKKLSTLVKPLASDNRKAMLHLLESVQTSDLDAAFNKYLPTLLREGNTNVKKVLSESSVTVSTGNRKPVDNNEGADKELAQIMTLAGIKRN